MICFPNAKINIGLQITEKRADGYHNINSVFYPIGIRDILEVLLDFEGYPIILNDTAGIRSTRSEIEKIGIKTFIII